MVYVINNWNGIYENAGSRKVERLFWIPIPNKHDSFGFRMLMDRPNGTALYGAWVLFVQVASRCDVRGTLVKNGVPLTPAMISMLTHAPESLISEMLDAVQSKGIEWVSTTEAVASQPSTSQVVADRVSDSNNLGNLRARDVLYCSSSVLSSELQGAVSEKPPDENSDALVAAAAERLYAVHPKKKNLVLVPEALQSAVAEESDLAAALAIIESSHAAWCQSEQWTESGGRFAPKLDEWIADRGYTALPPGSSKKPAKAATIDASKIIEYDPFGLHKKRREAVQA